MRSWALARPLHSPGQPCWTMVLHAWACRCALLPGWCRVLTVMWCRRSNKPFWRALQLAGETSKPDRDGYLSANKILSNMDIVRRLQLPSFFAFTLNLQHMGHECLTAAAH